MQSPLCPVNHSHQCDDHSSNQTIVQSQEQGGNKSSKPDGLNKRQKVLCRILLKILELNTHTHTRYLIFPNWILHITTNCTNLPFSHFYQHSSMCCYDIHIHLTINTFVTYQLYFARSPEKGEIWELHKHSFQVDDHNGRQDSLKHSTFRLTSLVSKEPPLLAPHCSPAALPHPLPTHFLRSSDGMFGAMNTWIFRTWLTKMGLGKPGLYPSSKPASRGSELNLALKELLLPWSFHIMVLSTLSCSWSPLG